MTSCRYGDPFATAGLVRGEGFAGILPEHTPEVTVMMVLGLIGAWSLLPLPLAVAVGRLLAVGAGPDCESTAPIAADDPMAAR